MITAAADDLHRIRAELEWFGKMPEHLTGSLFDDMFANLKEEHLDYRFDFSKLADEFEPIDILLEDGALVVVCHDTARHTTVNLPVELP